jgi:starvation-inducible DNA-binding protein
MDTKGLIPRNKSSKSTKIVEQLNTVLASMQVLYNNIHAAHWNLECSDFVYLHKYFDEIYATTGDHIDVYAEYVRIQGEFPIHSLAQYLDKSLISEASFKQTNEREAIFNKRIEDTATIKGYLKTMFEETEAFPPINDYVATTLDDLGKRLWFFKASMAHK